MIIIHKREEGLAICLLKASNAVAKIKLKPFYCEAGMSCEYFKKCSNSVEIIRPCGRSNPKLGGVTNGHKGKYRYRR